MPIRELARAKINLTLSVLGRREDGYHELESLVTFAEAGDRVTLRPGPGCSVSTIGPFAGDIVGPNLLETAAALLQEADPGLRPGAVELEKTLPVAAGLGGGSADAAALLRAVRTANPERAGNVPWQEIAARLGADVPVCLAGKPALVWGTGTSIAPLPAGAAPPAVAAVLANPRLALPTARVFEALQAGPVPSGRPAPALPGPFPTLESLVEYMRGRGNDLEAPAARLLPVIGDIKSAIAAAPGCRIAALSGSGATCFGLFESDESAASAAAAITGDHPSWWVAATRLAGAAGR
jgi:4-diphosphocytidyl-2-C-methyl-D-erythritol kinase